jgi:DnaJ-class molecular chaperone
METENKIFGEWQKCPKCDGQGTVSKPPGIAGDVYQWSSTSCTHQCDVCNGAKIIQRPIIKEDNGSIQS